MIECFDYWGPWSRLGVAFYDVLLPFALYVSVISGLLAWIIRRKEFAVDGGIALVVSFAALGGILGWSMGASRTPVVGALMPAFLTLISSLFVYLFSKENLTQWRPVIPYAILGMIISSLLGAANGSVMRAENQAAERKYNEWFLEYKNVKLETEKASLKKLIDETKKPLEISISERPACN